MPHDEWMYERVREGLVLDPEGARTTSGQRLPDLGMTLDQVRRVIAKVKAFCARLRMMYHANVILTFLSLTSRRPVWPAEECFPARFRGSIRPDVGM